MKTVPSSFVACFIVLVIAILIVTIASYYDHSKGVAVESDQRVFSVVSQIVTQSSLQSPDFIELYSASFGGPHSRTDVNASVLRPLSGQKQIAVYPPDDGYAFVQIRDIQTGKTCTTEDRLISRLFLSKNERVLLISGYYGAGNYFDIIDTDTCKPTSPTLSLAWTFEGLLTLQRLEFNSRCVNATIDGKVAPNVGYCHSSRVWNLNQNYQPVFDQAASDALTLKNMGVVFRGLKFVNNPQTSKASIDLHQEDYYDPIN